MTRFSNRFSKTLKVGDTSYKIASLKAVEKVVGPLENLPMSLKVLLENNARHCAEGKEESLQPFADWLQNKSAARAIDYRPARVLMQDFTGVPAIVDLAAMRDAVHAQKKDPRLINPLTPVDLVIDHSVMVDFFGEKGAFSRNVEKEFKRNQERYQFLRWGQEAFEHFRVVPPGTGICHQVNLEYLGKCVWQREVDGDNWAYPDTLVGTDSHTTMVNGLGILGWGVGGIEAEAAMLGQPISMLLPDVIGVELIGELPTGATATDLVLTITHLMRKTGVVAQFVEFYGQGLDHLSIADRATLGNMSPEFGSTCAFFPVDQKALDYLQFTGRALDLIQLVEAYSKEQGLWRDENTPAPQFSKTLTVNLADIVPTMAGPKRPQDSVALPGIKKCAETAATSEGADLNESVPLHIKGQDINLTHGDVVIAAITSCTNTSNPSVMVGAGLLAQKAHEKGLQVKPWVKTSFAPGSKVVTAYLEKAGLMKELEHLGFHLVGYGCTTCIGNSGPLLPEIEQAIADKELSVGAVLSGNRNFEGRIHARVKQSYLASPPLVVAYALAGSLRKDLTTEPLGHDQEGQPVFLKDIWPSTTEIHEVIQKSMTPEIFKEQYAGLFEGDTAWKDLSVGDSLTYPWDETSTYVKNPPYFTHVTSPEGPSNGPLIQEARILALLGDSITTDHISPAGAIKSDSPAGLYLQDKGVDVADFNSYGSRRGNHEVMMRGTFANIRLQNKMVPHLRGGYTCSYVNGDNGKETSIYDAAMAYQQEKTPLVIFAGSDYGAGSSRDWAAKGTRLLGVKAIIAQSFERIHRSNLIGMGVLPLQLPNDVTTEQLELTGEEVITLSALGDQRRPGETFRLEIQKSEGTHGLQVTSSLDTEGDVSYYNAGGILHYVLKQGV